MILLKTNKILTAFLFLALTTPCIKSAEGHSTKPPQDRVERARLERARLNQVARENGTVQPCPICLEEAPAQELFETECCVQLIHALCLNQSLQESAARPKPRCPLCVNEMTRLSKIQITAKAGLSLLTQTLQKIDKQIPLIQEQMRFAEAHGYHEQKTSFAELLRQLASVKQQMLREKAEFIKTQEELVSLVRGTP